MRSNRVHDLRPKMGLLIVTLVIGLPAAAVPAGAQTTSATNYVNSVTAVSPALGAIVAAEFNAANAQLFNGVSSVAAFSNITVQGAPGGGPQLVFGINLAQVNGNVMLPQGVVLENMGIDVDSPTSPLIAQLVGLNFFLQSVQGPPNGAFGAGCIGGVIATAVNCTYPSVDPARLGLTLAQSSVSGSIVNAGTITGATQFLQGGVLMPLGGTLQTDGITLNAVTAGGITNSGQISATNGTLGIAFNPVGILLTNSTVNGTVLNSGTLTVLNSAGPAIGIQVDGASTVNGGVVNTGVLSVSASTGSSGDGILVQGRVTGGITNTGTLSGSEGIVGASTSPLSIFDSGSIIGTGGTAIDLSHNAAGNTLTLGPGFFIAGNVLGQGADTFQLGGTGTGAFNLSSIGAGQQYQGFTTFNVSSATWVETGTGNESWTVANGATLQLGNGGSGANAGAINGNVVDNGIFAIDRADTYTYAGSISGSGSFVQMGSGTTVLSGSNSYSGGTLVTGGTLTLSGAGTLGAATGMTGIDTGATLNLGGTTQTQAVVSLAGGTVENGNLNALLNSIGGTINGIGGTASVTAIGNTTLVEGTNSYTGATDIISGALDVTGAITNSSAVTVNSGATLDVTGAVTSPSVTVASGGVLTGTGTVDPNTVTIASGATFTPGTAGVPGTSMTVAGNLAFQSGALYVVYLNSTTATFANVTGTASLAGTVDAVFLPGTGVGHYTILQSSGLNGTTFAGLTAPVSPNFVNSLSYTADDVLLNVTAVLGLGTTLNVNQQNVATALNNVFNTTGALPANFSTLFNLTGAPLANALSQLDGEDATGAQHGSIQLTNEFLNLMLDPFVFGRGGPASGGGPLGFAPDQEANLPADVALAYASILKAPAKPAAPSYLPWTVWGAGYGGSASFDGNATVGSTDLTASTYGFAAGADYHASPDTVLGFALAGAGTNWGLTQGLGSGRSDAFQAGLYGTKYFGPAYLGAALAFTNNWFTTNRTALGDQLTANFQGQSFGVRAEGGYRYAVTPAADVTPYAAIQTQNFYTPAYSETDLTGGGFGLSYNSQNATDTRSELGARFDDLTTWNAMPVQLRARLAWAHDWVSDPALSAVFEALPGSSFVVNGAPVPHNSALTTVGAELNLTPQWSLIGKFDGEFASSAQTYAGSGTLRYSW